MTNDIMIQDLFEKDIKRDIKGVIKVDQYDEDVVYTELDEYVITRETSKHLDVFFQRYYDAMLTPTDKIGVWVSGFFGSGKSHFIKMLSYLLENRNVKGKNALNFFQEKVEDPSIYSNIENSVNFGTKDVILFNIDSKASTIHADSEPIVNILMRAFNEKRGFYGKVFWIAELEEDLTEKGLYEQFKLEFQKIAGSPWEERRKSYSFEQDLIVDALVACNYQSRESLKILFKNDGANYHLDVETFAQKIKKYCESRGKDHQVIFLIDEIGQYIGENSKMMLNLQTIAEELGTKLAGKAWLMVTAQADIDAITEDRVKGYDFSKIQGRFDTRLSLSSANVDEVIKKRILAKKQEHNATLAAFFAEKRYELKNLLAFSKDCAEMKFYNGEEDFIDVYPYVPYQFFVLQKVFERIRRSGFTGKHLAKGERSMLNAFKEATEKYAEENLGRLIPFYSFYDTVEGFLDPIIKSTITQAQDNSELEEFDNQILKLLFLIRNVQEVVPNLDNLVVLSVSSVDEDKLELKKKVDDSLKRLEKQTLISKSGDRYHFLTNEEQEINREIKNTEVENYRILDTIYTYVFGDSSEVCPARYKDYKFNRAVDEKYKSAGADLSVKFLTPLSDELYDKSDQQSLSGDVLSNVDSKDTLLFVFPQDSKVVDLVRNHLKIEKYLRQNTSNSGIKEINEILSSKDKDKDKLIDEAKREVFESAKNARVFVDGKEVSSIEKKNPKERVKDGLDILSQNVYSKASYVTYDYESDRDVLRVLKSDDLEKFGAGTSDTNKNALAELRDYINIRHQKNDKLVLKDIKERFSSKPYGWKDMTIAGLVATLFANEEIKLSYQKTALILKSENADEIARYLTKREDADRIVVKIREKSNKETIKAVRDVLNDVFDRTAIPEKENDLFEYTKQVFSEKRDAAEKYAGRYQEVEVYPGREEIRAYSDFLKEINQINDPSDFLQEVADKKDELVRLSEEARPAISFFESQMVDIFSKMYKRADNYERNLQFLDADMQDNVRTVKEILKMDKPYGRIKELPQLGSKIDEALQQSLDTLKEEAYEKLDSRRTEVARDIDSYGILEEDFKDRILQRFDNLRDRIATCEECVYAKSLNDSIDDLYEDVSGEIIRQVQIIREKNVDDGGEEQPRVKPTKVVKASEFTSQKKIETEEDLEEYLDYIRQQLKKLLEENKITVI
ncbi:BREX system P-loop protein BrxC [Methanohalophilus sp. RSK]|uniref:BREX system P-loop protein BrxC n=1 Tax=Methanohalophilus sp. RSK TaxID=2485783 RepID=UPI000F43C335|nr:BREX system P-loop protein BrxC [Methanohalophilus sp. RSK]RNI11896.1 BREX system P-loop protein BrxC [Methanohalophilus sp. RSK]